MRWTIALHDATARRRSRRGGQQLEHRLGRQRPDRRRHVLQHLIQLPGSFVRRPRRRCRAACAATRRRARCRHPRCCCSSCCIRTASRAGRRRCRAAAHRRPRRVRARRPAAAAITRSRPPFAPFLAQHLGVVDLAHLDVAGRPVVQRRPIPPSARTAPAPAEQHQERAPRFDVGAGIDRHLADQLPAQQIGELDDRGVGPRRRRAR